jgi:hypothetical protein
MAGTLETTDSRQGRTSVLNMIKERKKQEVLGLVLV